MNNGLFIPETEMRKFEAQLKFFDKQLTEKVKKIITSAAYRVKSKAGRNLTANKSRVTSALLTSLKVTKGDTGISAMIWSDKDYAAPVEFGTKSKKQVPPELAELASKYNLDKDIPFNELYQGIKLWVKRKGLPKSAAWPIARSISQHGQAAHPFLFPALQAEKQKFLQDINNILK